MAKVKSPDQPQREPLAAQDRPFKRGPKAGAATDEPIVLDNLPELIPVTGPELEVIETYLGTLIDGLLAERPQAQRSPFSLLILGSPSGAPVLDRN